MAAARADDDEQFWSAIRDIPAATRKARPGEVPAAIEKLTPIFERITFGMGGELARPTGGMVDHATDPAVVLPTLTRRAIDVMEQAVRFERAHHATYGRTPLPEDGTRIELTMQRFVGDADRHGLTEADAAGLVEAWSFANAWMQPVLHPAQRKDVRAMVPDRDRLTAAVEAARERIDTASWLHDLLRVLDDEPPIVLHRASGAGFRVTVSGIGDNFQLHTLLAAALLGTHLPGGRPPAAEIAAASDGDPAPPGGIRGHFNLADRRRRTTGGGGGPLVEHGRTRQRTPARDRRLTATRDAASRHVRRLLRDLRPLSERPPGPGEESFEQFRGGTGRQIADRLFEAGPHEDGQRDAVHFRDHQFSCGVARPHVPAAAAVPRRSRGGVLGGIRHRPHRRTPRHRSDEPRGCPSVTATPVAVRGRSASRRSPRSESLIGGGCSVAASGQGNHGHPQRHRFVQGIHHGRT